MQEVYLDGSMGTAGERLMCGCGHWVWWWECSKFSYDDSVCSVRWEARSLAKSRNLAGDAENIRRQGGRHEVVVQGKGRMNGPSKYTTSSIIKCLPVNQCHPN